MELYLIILRDMYGKHVAQPIMIDVNVPRFTTMWQVMDQGRQHLIYAYN